MKHTLTLLTTLLFTQAAFTSEQAPGIKTVKPGSIVTPTPVTPPARDFKPMRFHPPGQNPVQNLPLDGSWLFQPVEGGLTAQALDAEAKRMAESTAPIKPGNWHPLAVPQFLNRYAWWLDISRKFTARSRSRARNSI